MSGRDDLAGLARVAAGAWLRTARWGVGIPVRIARGVVDPRASESLRDYMRDLLGVSELDERVEALTPTGSRDPDEAAAEDAELRARGAELLRRSADIDLEDGTHPAYARILHELAPDEARILRLLAVEGPRPAVDVRSVQLIGLGSQLAAEGLNMIGQEAGCRHPDRVPSYLNNLYRLGLIWFSKEAVEDPLAYQVLEAQPDVLDAVKSSARAKTVHRSIRLTPFGRDFVEFCLPLGEPERREPADPA